MVEKVDIAGLKAGIRNCLEGRIAKRLALANALVIGMLLKILERGAAYAYNRDAGMFFPSVTTEYHILIM